MGKIQNFWKNFQLWHERSEKVVSMNSRNLDYVYPSNLRRDYQLADNKLLTKETLEPLGFGLCETYFSYQYFYELSSLTQDLQTLESFVIKPAQGSGGNGIMVIKQRVDDKFITMSGEELTLKELKTHIANIIFGVFALGLNDSAIIEERLIGHEDLSEFNTLGLCDIRLIYFKSQPVQAMLRIATKASKGKANLHQGGIGIAIELKTGKTSYAQHERKDLSTHPETGVDLIGKVIPMWDEVLELSQKVAQTLPLNYLGIDIAIGEKKVVILEVNARPGIEIQNVNHSGMRPMLEAIKI